MLFSPNLSYFISSLSPLTIAVTVYGYSREQRRDDDRFCLLAHGQVPHQLARPEPLRDVPVGPHGRPS